MNSHILGHIGIAIYRNLFHQVARFKWVAHNLAFPAGPREQPCLLRKATATTQPGSGEQGPRRDGTETVGTAET